MQKLVFIYFILFFSPSWTYQYPQVSLSFNNNKTPPSTIYYGETLEIPLQMSFAFLDGYKAWSLPSGALLQLVAGNCPALNDDRRYYYLGTCYMKVIIPGNSLGKNIAGAIYYRVFGKELIHRWDQVHTTAVFSVTVIPHPLSMSVIPIQQGTAKLGFLYNLKAAVKYYDENALAGKPAQGIVTPTEQDGLYFDPSQFAIVGKPKRTGTYLFKVAAKNANGIAATTDLKIEVTINPKDKPMFKAQYYITSAMRNQKYSMNLMELIAPQAGFMESNQITFRIVSKDNTPTWLHITNDDTPRLIGNIPSDIGDQDLEVELIASSNTGGDSAPFIIRIPVAYDPAKKPTIEYFELQNQVGNGLYEDLSRYITDPSQDSNLKVIIDKVEPLAPWLRVSSLNPTVLEGIIPEEVVGQTLQVTLRANTLIGGSSEPITVPIQIKINPLFTPQLKISDHNLPKIYPGQTYSFDFRENELIFPDYNWAPYTIEFAKNHEQPGWLRIENNKLISSQVPEDLALTTYFYITIKNIPGGESKPIKLMLRSINYKGPT